MSRPKVSIKTIGVSILALVATGCSTLPKNAGTAVPLLSGPPPKPGVTKMEDALRCLAEHYPRNRDIRLAVNDLTDGTGATMDGSALAKVLTQRPDVMMTIGLAKTGVRLVNRSSTGVAEWEIRQSMQKYIGDGRNYTEPGSSIRLPYRPVMAGTILGSTHYVTGAITELNWNVYSNVKEAGIGNLKAGSRQYRISLAVDLIVTDSRTTEIVMARSYSKQLVGTETAFNMFRFFDVGSAGRNIGPNEAFEFNIGKEMNEPVQTAVRWMLETAAYDIVTQLAGIGNECDDLVPDEDREIRPQSVAAAAEPQPQQVVAVAEGGSNAPSANFLTGINLFADDGAIIVRADTTTPLPAEPVLVKNSRKQIVFDLYGVRAGPVGANQLSLGNVRGVSLTDFPDRLRITIQLDQRVRHTLRRQGRSALIILMPAKGAARQAIPTPAPAPDVAAPVENVQPQIGQEAPTSNSMFNDDQADTSEFEPEAQPLEAIQDAPDENATAGEMLNNANAPSLLEPKKTDPLKSTEQILPIIQP